MLTCSRAHTHMHAYTYAHSEAHTQSHAHMHTHTQCTLNTQYANTNIHTYTHTHTHAVTSPVPVNGSGTSCQWTAKSLGTCLLSTLFLSIPPHITAGVKNPFPPKAEEYATLRPSLMGGSGAGPSTLSQESQSTYLPLARELKQNTLGRKQSQSHQACLPGSDETPDRSCRVESGISPLWGLQLTFRSCPWHYPLPNMGSNPIH